MMIRDTCELQVVAIDMRGYGESDKPKDRRAYDLSELTSDVSEVIKALGHKECALCASGHLINRVTH